jgi:hypothetical protein
MFKFSLLIAFAALAFNASAQSAFEQAMVADTSVMTEESNAEFFGVKYRKIATKTATFYAKASQTGGPDAIEVYCGQPSFFTSTHLKEGNSIEFQRSREFMKKLNESCNSPGKKKVMDLVLQPKDGAKK